ncbi:MAG: molybdopterin converting factor subunit 1 [Chloroflexi bacterium]|nr:molybdopterin converting factor subunit 1 [Chloroflexota bacterium]
MNKVELLFFATLKEKAGTTRSSMEIPEKASVKEFKSLLREKFPALPAGGSSILVAINREYAFDDEEIPKDAEIALFPPVSGGSAPTIFSITENEIDLNAMLAQITLPTTGAACFFSGMVRSVTTRGEGYATEHLEYEAYVPMAEAKIQQVAEEIRAQWPEVEGIAIVQRVGLLQPGTPTVLIACTAGHRDSGVFEAARYGIDRLKQIVPIWKKEIGTHGEIWVEGEYVPSQGD